MRKIIFALVLTLTPQLFALSALDLARTLINGPHEMNEYSGVTPKGISCMTSLQLREGKLEAHVVWGDTGSGIKADLDSNVKILSNAGGVTTLQLSHFDEPSMTLTMKIKNRKITSMVVDADDWILFIPRRSHVACDELEQFIPKY